MLLMDNISRISKYLFQNYISSNTSLLCETCGSYSGHGSLDFMNMGLQPICNVLHSYQDS
jgi:hypothetical protein